MAHDREAHEANNMAADEMVDAFSRMLTDNDNLCLPCVTLRLTQSLMVALVLGMNLSPKKSRRMLKHFSSGVEDLVKRAQKGEVVVTVSNVSHRVGN